MSYPSQGFIAYRYNKKYYRRFLGHNAEPSRHGQSFADTVPRDPPAFKEWVASKITMLENTQTCNRAVVHYELESYDPRDNLPHECGFELRHDLEWTFVGSGIQYTYIIDLDNLVFTINGTTHLKLCDMPPGSLGIMRYFVPYYGTKTGIPPRHLTTAVKLWTAPHFDTAARQREYEALQPIVTPAGQWGAPTWDKLSFSQHFSINLTQHLVSQTSSDMAHAYIPGVWKKAGFFCWNVLCAATSSVPLGCYSTSQKLGHRERIISPTPLLGYYSRLTPSRLVPYNMISRIGTRSPKSFERFGGDYCWVRGNLITFCLHLSDPAYVVHEVEQMVRRMRLEGRAECVGIILSSQQEMVAVAIDDGPGSVSPVRHTPVLDIRSCPGKPGEASEGLLLMVQLLSPILTVPQLPWRAPPSQPSSTPSGQSQPNLPLEILQCIIGYTTTPDYLSLRLVSRAVRSACLSCPRYADYTLLSKRPGRKLMYAAKFADDDASTVLGLSWMYEGWSAEEFRWGVPLGSEDEEGGQGISSSEGGDW